MELREGLAPFGEWSTWYRLTGGGKPGLAPLVVLHGGPGCTHAYVESFADLAASGRLVVHYDQIGCGGSTWLPERGADFFTVDLFLAELRNLLDHLGISGRFHLLGQSWGGMLASEFAVMRPEGLRGLVIADSPASMPLWIAETAKLCAQLPPDVQAVLNRHQEDGTTDHPDYKRATEVFNARHVCRLDPMPDSVARTFRALEQNPHVYNVMNGPNEFHVTGSLRDWSVIDRLDRIAAPTLVIAGAYDEATPACTAPFRERIARVESHVFPNSSHMPHVEEREACMALVDAFLARCD